MEKLEEKTQELVQKEQELDQTKQELDLGYILGRSMYQNLSYLLLKILWSAESFPVIWQAIIWWSDYHKDCQ